VISEQIAPVVPTVGEIARRTGYPVHKIEYVIRARDIAPTGRAGNAYIYGEADVQHVTYELQRIDREREPKSVATGCQSAGCQLNVALN